MIKLRILEILEQKGKSKYWLHKQMGMDASSFKKLANNETTRISFETIDALCQILECTPNDLFVFDL